MQKWLQMNERSKMPKYSSFSWMSTFVVAGTLAATVRCSPSANVDTQFLAMKNIAHQDQAVLQPPSAIEAASCTGPVASNPSTYWLDLQDHTGNGRGYAPFLPGDFTYPVYRNVKSYNAVGDGNADDTQNLQNAINDDGNGGNRYKNEVTTRPAEVFVPGGTYKLTSHLDMRLNTILVGDPNNMPVFKASPDFNGDTVVNGSDYATVISDGTTAFLTAMKNIIIDTTSIAPDTTVLALQWGVAQACQLTNVKINMPTNSKGHTGIALDQGSTTAVTDVVSSLCQNLERVRAEICSLSLEAPLVSAIRISRSISNQSRSHDALPGCPSPAGMLPSYKMPRLTLVVLVLMLIMGVDHPVQSLFSTRRR